MTIEIRLCPTCCCDKPMKRFRNKTVTLNYEGEAMELGGLSGWGCQVCGEMDFDRAFRVAYAKAGDGLIERHRNRAGK